MVITAYNTYRYINNMHAFICERGELRLRALLRHQEQNLWVVYGSYVRNERVYINMFVHMANQVPKMARNVPLVSLSLESRVERETYPL
jgi:hypothetical protein